MKNLIRKEVQQIKGYRLTRYACQAKLNQNESPYDLPPALKEKALARFKDLSWNRYPTPHGDSLRKLIAEREGLSVLSQAVGETVLEDDSYVAPLVQKIILEREKLFAACAGIPSGRDWFSPHLFLALSCSALR